MKNNGYINIDEVIKPASEMLQLSCKDGKAYNKDMEELMHIFDQIKKSAESGATYCQAGITSDYVIKTLTDKGYRIKEGDFIDVIHWD